MIQLRLHWLSGEPVLRNVSVPLDAPLSELRSQLNAAAGKPIRALIAGSKQQLDWRCTVSQAGLQNNATVMALAEERPQPYDKATIDQMDLQFFPVDTRCEMSNRPLYEISIRPNKYDLDWLYSVPCANTLWRYCNLAWTPCASWILLKVPRSGSRFEDRILELQWIEDYLIHLSWERVRKSNTFMRFICPSCAGIQVSRSASALSGEADTFTVDDNNDDMPDL